MTTGLNLLLQKHQHYQQSLYIASDLAGLIVNGEAISTYQQKKLALIVSKNPSLQAQNKKRIVPLTALFASSPLTNKPLLLEIILASGLNPVEYFRHYCQRLLSGQLHLLLRYGVVLGGDLETSLLLFEENQPYALMIAECNKVLICKNTMYSNRFNPAFPSASTSITDSLDEVRNKFLQSNLQNNLSYWIRCLNQFYGLELEKLWRIVRESLENRLRELAYDEEIDPAVFDLQKKGLLSTAWQHPCLLVMRLHASPKEMYRQVHNPLANY